MTTSKTPRSLDLCALGLGQAGGWLAAEWRRRGYRALVLNTARTDLRALLGRHAGLEVPVDDHLDISAEGLDGAGRDPDFGRRCVRAHAAAIRSAAQSRLDGADAFLLMAGLGGGTGSAVDELARVLEPLGTPIVVVSTLPSDGESAIAKVNAVRAADAIARLPIAGRVFVDNGRLLDAFPGVDVVSYFQKVNARVLQPLDELNALNGREDCFSLRSFDGEDLRRVLLSSGTLLVHAARLKEGALNATDVVAAALRAIDGGDFLAAGSDVAGVAYLAVVVSGPERLLKQVPIGVFEAAAEELKKQTRGGAVFDGVYVTPDGEPLQALVLASSLSTPERVSALVARATLEATALAQKVAGDVTGIDTTPLAGLALFRGPRGAGSLLPTPASSVLMAATPAPASADVPPARANASPPLPVAETARAVSSTSPHRAIPASTSLPPLPATEASTSLPPLPVVAAAVAVAAPPMQLSSTSLPPTVARQLTDAARPLPATAEPSLLADALLSSSQLQSVPDEPMLPPPVLTPGSVGFSDAPLRVATAAPAVGAASDDHTQEGDDASLALPSLPAGPQADAEDMVARYRAGDRKTRERIGRKILEDSRAPDVAVRMLAVWAMVQLKDGAFRRALTRCSNDENAEIAKLAIEGLDLLGDVAGVE